MADLVAVIGRDRQFENALPAIDQLDNDFRVEVKIIGVEREGQGGQGIHPIDPVAGVEFRQRGPEQAVLAGGQDPVADEFIGRHAAGAGGALGHHARPEHRIGFPRRGRSDQVRQAFRCILAVAMDQRDDVKALPDGEIEPDLLVAAIALVDRIVEHMDREAAVARGAVAHGRPEGVIMGLVVDDQDFDIIGVAQTVGDPVEHRFDRLLCVVSYDEDQQPGAARHGNVSCACAWVMVLCTVSCGRRKARVAASGPESLHP